MLPEARYEIITKYVPTPQRLRLIARIPLLREIVATLMTRWGGRTELPGISFDEAQALAIMTEEVSPDGLTQAVAQVRRVWYNPLTISKRH